MDLKDANNPNSGFTQCVSFVRGFTGLGGRVWLQLANPDSPNAIALRFAAGPTCVSN